MAAVDYSINMKDLNKRYNLVNLVDLIIVSVLSKIRQLGFWVNSLLTVRTDWTDHGITRVNESSEKRTADLSKLVLTQLSVITTR